MNATARHVQPGDLQGITRLVIRASTDLTSLVEAMHARIARIPGLAGTAGAERTRGMTGMVYGSVRGITRGIGAGLDAVLGALASQMAADLPSSVARCAAVAALNGILGDYLAASRNPLAIRMRLRHGGRPLVLEREALAGRFPNARPHIVLLAHGLCMNDLQWLRNGHDHGAAMADDLPCSPVYLHYNSGLPISVNGLRFARQLESLLRAWPVPVRRLSIVGHSMGGLVARSACLHGARLAHTWPSRLDAMVFLGTPHRGAPLERGGHWIDRLLQVSPYSAPFARLGMIRSAGITDLRYGIIDDAAPDARHAGVPPTPPLPPHVRCLAIAATIGKRHGDLKDRLLGDGLVPLSSALGRGGRGQAPLFERHAQWVSYGTGHLGLLDRPIVYRRIEAWLNAR